MILQNRYIRVLLYLTIISAILVSNYLLYRIDDMQPLSNYAVIGSIVDFIVVIPAVTYFFIIRKKYSWKAVAVTVLAGYFAAVFIVPKHHMQHVSFIPKILVFLEAGFFIIELYFLYFILRSVVNGYKTFKKSQNNSAGPYALMLRKSLEKETKINPIAEIYLTEWIMFHFALFSWKKKTAEGPKVFTYHLKTGFTALNIMLIHAIALESVGFHYLLAGWNEWVAYILLILNIYTILFLVSNIQAVRKQPFVLTSQELFLQVGITKGIVVPLENIKEVRPYDGPAQLKSAELNETFEAYVADFVQEKPQFEILLSEPQEYILMYGIKRKASRILIRVDNPSMFYDKIRESISETA